ncbi:MAG TPA: hypothetical protein PLD47_16575 [Aggregatilineales bacterium]|nr:hypothetical protein [Anaerolineales bacterium]HRE49341.1 hypothetical protein [Aggregatilineales bacterium]
MNSLVYLIKQIAPGIWLICAAALLLRLRALMLARRKLAIAEFDLERELAEGEQARAITWSVLILELALAVVAVYFVVEPTIRQDILSGVIVGEIGGGGVAEGPFETSTPGGTGEDIASMNQTAAALPVGTSVGLILTAVASPTPVGTLLAGYPTPTDCTTDQARLLIPAPGQLLFDSVTVVGTATIPNFAFYKLELAGPSTGGGFAPILGERTSPVTVTGTLGILPLNSLQPGDYDFRLAVFDNTGAMRASCTVRVNIILPPPTSTPPGG